MLKHDSASTSAAIHARLRTARHLPSLRSALFFVVPLLVGACRDGGERLAGPDVRPVATLVTEDGKTVLPQSQDAGYGSLDGQFLTGSGYAFGTDYAVVWSLATPTATPLILPSIASGSVARARRSDGTVVGEFSVGTPAFDDACQGSALTCGAIWTPVPGEDMQFRPLLPPAGFTSSTAVGIDAEGTVIGMASDVSTRVRRVVLWRNGETTASEVVPFALPGADREFIAAGNAAGFATGSASFDGGGRVVLWSTTAAPRLLSEVPGALRADSRSVNGAGVVVGEAFFNDETNGRRLAAVRWSGDQVEVLPSPPGAVACTASGVNAVGHVIGTCSRSLEFDPVEPGNAAVVWRDGKVFVVDGSVSNPSDTRSGARIMDDGRVLVIRYTATLNARIGVVFTPSFAEPNVAPVVTAVQLPASPVLRGSSVTATARFTDGNTTDTHTANFTWGTTIAAASSVVSPVGATQGTATGSFTFAAPGIYTVQATVSDGTASGSRSSSVDVPGYVAVVDPAAGSVSGDGWITSPADACIPSVCGSLNAVEGRATFAFTSQYRRGSATPSGSTAFTLEGSGFRFASTTTAWLVVDGFRAQYTGVGTLNGRARYGYLVVAIDGALRATDRLDRFRIRIWDLDQPLPGGGHVVVYDNQRAAAETSNAATPVASGKIQIRR